MTKKQTGSAPDPRKRGKRTPGRITGTPLSAPLRLTDAEWLEVGQAYCPTFHAALLAEAAVAATHAVQTAEDSFTRAKAQQHARRAARAYEGYVKASRVPAGSMEARGCDAAEWKAAITGIVDAYMTRADMEAKAPPVSATVAWLERLGGAAADLIAAYRMPLDASARSIARADLENGYRRPIPIARSNGRGSQDLTLRNSSHRWTARRGRLCRRLGLGAVDH